ncbi:aKG-HExxH-type peptide beta-hydroxylase [Streptomyces sp. NPDC048179]|uniref:aKG-HExxH-type peptide beta-hydroxylase n=1 Tax=Streptomyces sp. NPDC048179 TaxID=3365506 RepID=UPI00371303F3
MNPRENRRDQQNQREQRDNGYRGGAAHRFTPHRPVIPSAGPAPRLSVVVEDIDPYRDVHGLPVQSRLDDLMSELAADCACLWSVLVPLRLAETVLHETSHLALAALTDLADPQDQTRHRVRWRPDLRPLGAALTGTHAHLGLLEFRSRVYHELGGAPARAAETRLYRYGRQVVAALRVLQRNRTALTTWGTCFVENRKHIPPSGGRGQAAGPGATDGAVSSGSVVAECDGGRSTKGRRGHGRNGSRCVGPATERRMPPIVRKYPSPLFLLSSDIEPNRCG